MFCCENGLADCRKGNPLCSTQKTPPEFLRLPVTNGSHQFSRTHNLAGEHQTIILSLVGPQASNCEE